jgi:hypothetical protein
MEIVDIEATRRTPKMYLDESAMVIKISGSSLPEDAIQTYQPVMDWIDNINPNFESELVCELYFEFLNSTSHKMVYEILTRLEEFQKKGRRVKVIWYYDEMDEDLMEMGEQFVALLDVSIEIVEKF